MWKRSRFRRSLFSSVDTDYFLFARHPRIVQEMDHPEKEKSAQNECGASNENAPARQPTTFTIHPGPCGLAIRSALTGSRASAGDNFQTRVCITWQGPANLAWSGLYWGIFWG